MNPIQYEQNHKVIHPALCPFEFGYIYQYKDVVCNWHKHIEILLVEQGCGFIQCGTKEYPLWEGDLFVINSEAIHHIYSKEGISFRFIIIKEHFCIENGINVKQIRFKEKIDDENTVCLFRLMATEIQDAKFQKKFPYLTKARAAVLNLLSDLCTNHLLDNSENAMISSETEQHIKKAITYLNEHYTKPFHLETISDYLGINKHYFSRIFKNQTGQTPLTYANTLRCIHAEYALSNGMNVTEAAYDCGFESLAYFSRTYKSIRGISPTEFKKNLT